MASGRAAREAANPPVGPETARSEAVRNRGVRTAGTSETDVGLPIRPGSRTPAGRSAVPRGPSQNDGETAGDPAARAHFAPPGPETAGDPSSRARSGAPGPETPPAGPPIWLIRNKIDLVLRLARSESSDQTKHRSEPNNQTNDLLKTMVNQRYPASQ